MIPFIRIHIIALWLAVFSFAAVAQGPLSVYPAADPPQV